VSEQLTVQGIIDLEARRDRLSIAEVERIVAESLSAPSAEREADPDYVLAMAAAFIYLRNTAAGVNRWLPLVNWLYVVLKAKDAELRQAQALRWSSEPPAEPGWYWYREHDGAATSYAVRISKGISRLILMALVGSSQTVIASEQKGQWAGPLVLPGEVNP
jgi:hypothetical protein